MSSTATAAAAKAAAIQDRKYNAIQHGLTAQHLILPNESAAEYQQLAQDYFAEWRPQGATQVELVRELAQAAWRLRRARRQEAAFFNACIADQQTQNSKLSYDEASARVFLDKDYSRRMSLFLRYQSAIERAYQRAFADLRAAKRAQAAYEEARALGAALDDDCDIENSIQELSRQYLSQLHDQQQQAAAAPRR